MGTPIPENSIRHFSHPHPLFPSSLNPQDHLSSCVVCELKLSSLPSYTCQPCNFHIHLKCFELPQKIRHSFDENHLLSLISSPKYQDGRFLCDACKREGDGFAYHCGECMIDLHTDCANLPSQVTHQSHPHHQLSLTFSTLEDGSRSSFVAPGSFRCNVCHGGFNSWFYSCKECGGFAAHLFCATRNLPSPPNFVQHEPSLPNLVEHEPNRVQPQCIGTTPFVDVPNPYDFDPNPVISNSYRPNPVINNPYSFGTTNPMDSVRPLINEVMNNSAFDLPPDPRQVSHLRDLLGPLGIGGAGPFHAYSPSSSSVSLPLDPSEVAGLDPYLLSTMFSEQSFKRKKRKNVYSGLGFL